MPVLALVGRYSRDGGQRQDGGERGGRQLAGRHHLRAAGGHTGGQR